MNDLINTADETKRQERLHALRINAANALDNAVAETAALMDELATYDDLDEASAMIFGRIEDCLGRMRSASRIVTPTRPIERLGI